MDEVLEHEDFQLVLDDDELQLNLADFEPTGNDDQTMQEEPQNLETNDEGVE